MPASRRSRACFVWSCLVACWVAGAADATIISTFDADLDGWTAAGGSGTPEHTATGGNPDGFLFIDNLEGAVVVTLFAPAKFLGDQSSLDGGTLSFDGNLLEKTSVAFTPIYGRVTLRSGGLSSTLDLQPNDPPIGVWTRYSAPLTAAAWGTTQQNWDAILANVTAIEVILEAVSGFETNGFDNFALVPEPSLATLLVAAFVAAGVARARRCA